MSNEAVVVFTAKSAQRIIEEGGTSSWRLDRSHARLCGYAVCTRNTHADWAEGTEAHHSAFLVGKIHDVVPCEPTPENNESPNHRFLIQFTVGTMPHADVMRSIELFGNEVAPAVRKALAPVPV